MFIVARSPSNLDKKIQRYYFDGGGDWLLGLHSRIHGPGEIAIISVIIVPRNGEL